PSVPWSSTGFLRNVTNKALITTPIISERIYISTPEVAPGIKNIKNPPCGTAIPEPNNIDKPPVTDAPIVTENKTLIGSATAKGIAPSVIKDNPSIHADFPASLCSLLYLCLPITVEDNAIAKGGTIPEIIVAAITVLTSPLPKFVNEATPKKYAAFPTGPAKSIAIIAPIIIPNKTELIPVSPSSQLVKPSFKAVNGTPIT